MPTTIVSSPNVKGDISQCTTNVAIINGASRTSLFYVEDIGYATNNCTGKTDIYHSWELSGFSVFSLVILGIIFIIGCLMFLGSLT